MQPLVDRVQLVIARDERAVRASPDHIGGEVAVVDVGVGALDPSLQLGDQRLDGGAGVRGSDGVGVERGACGLLWHLASPVIDYNDRCTVAQTRGDRDLYRQVISIASTRR
jgi:hypothetical protein